jgi:phosphatidylglycerophosphatase C
MPPDKTVVFDFDGTLVSRDTGYEFNKWLIRRSWVRVSLLVVFAPVIGLLVSNARSRIYGINIASIIASCAQRSSLFQLRKAFLEYYFNEGGARAFRQGIEELHENQRSHSVVVISGCPDWLLYGALKYLGINRVKSIGSQCRVCCGALVFTQHCYHKNKVRMARLAGLDPKTWIRGYSDNTADIPMLELCHTQVLVNAAPEKLRKFKSRLNGQIEFRAWH